MRVKIIEDDSVWELEKKINEFLKDIDDDKIIDIKYQGIGSSPVHGLDSPSVMVIMKD